MEWVVDWFSDHGPLPRETVEERPDANYLEEGWIDSLKFIKLLSATEERFGIEFTNDEFQDRSFATVEGFVRLVEEKRG